MADLTPDDLMKAAKDSFYVSLGLGLMAFQKAQVRRQELNKQIATARSNPSMTQVNKLVGDNLKMVEERMKDAEERLEAALDDVQAQLPDPAREAVGAARAAAKEARDALRKVIDSAR